jgi:RNA recognition motif-containing protein
VEVKPAVSKQEMATKIKKIFVGGIPLALSENAFKEYFKKYGEITDVQIVKDRATGRSRGFGFVRYQDPSSVKRVMKEKHYLGNKLVRFGALAIK